MAYLPGNFRQRVQELLKQHDMNSEDLAKLVGVSTDTVRRMLKASEGGEDGSPKVSVDAIIKMAKCFNVSTDFLLGISTMPDATICSIIKNFCFTTDYTDSHRLSFIFL